MNWLIMMVCFYVGKMNELTLWKVISKMVIKSLYKLEKKMNYDTRR